MTSKELALYLHLPIYTIYYSAEVGKMLGRKVGGTWKFDKAEIDQWRKEKAPSQPATTLKRPR